MQTETDSPTISRLWLDECRDELRALPAYLLAGVVALGLLCGVLVSWLTGG